MQTKQKLVLTGIIVGSLSIAALVAWGKHPIQQERTVKITLTETQLNIVLKGLGKLPLEEVGDTYFAVRNQAVQQLNAPVDPPKKDSTNKKKN